MNHRATLRALCATFVVAVGCSHGPEPRLAPGTPRPSDPVISTVGRVSEVRATRWYAGWAISSDTKILMDGLGPYEGRFLRKAAADVLSITFDEDDPSVQDDEVCVRAWFEIPPADQIQFPLRIAQPEMSAKSCACAWGVCSEVESSGNVHLMSLSDAGVVAEVVLKVGELQIRHRGTFAPDAPHEGFTEEFEMPQRSRVRQEGKRIAGAQF